ncbi:MAG TPA: hypothetical protein VFU19_14290 [Iamia sp.]|nr:hypothetical protein [Iamia sp.]
MEGGEAVAADVPAVVEVHLRAWRAAGADPVPADRLDAEADLRRHHHDGAGALTDPDATVRSGSTATAGCGESSTPRATRS